MTRRRRLALWTALVALVTAAGAIWYFTPSLVRGLVFFRPRIEHEAVAAPQDVAAVQERVDAALAALGAAEGPGLEHTDEERTDTAGAWTVQHARWDLPLGTDASELGGRLRALLTAQEATCEVYVVHGEAGEAQVRAYAGTRLATVVDLVPGLRRWPVLSPSQHPQLALVLTDIDADPHVARAQMAAGQPLAMALSPYSPFTLRLSRDALTTHSEVLAWAEPDATPSESLEGVPWATGVLMACAPQGEPEEEAVLLARADVYVLDATEGGLDPRWFAAFEEAGVPVLHPLVLDPDDLDTSQRRLRHAAAQRGGAIMTLPVASSAAALDGVRDAADRGYRVAFPAEVVSAAPR